MAIGTGRRGCDDHASVLPRPGKSPSSDPASATASTAARKTRFTRGASGTSSARRAAARQLRQDTL
jgi:hypothetical protein